MKSLEWESCDKVGCKERLFETVITDYLKLYKCPNNIIVVALENKNLKYEFERIKTNQRIKKGTEFMTIDGKKVSLPFNCKIVEYNEFGSYYEYCLIVLAG